MPEIREIRREDIPACATLLMDAYNREPWCDHWTTELAETYLAEFFAAQRFQGFLLEEECRAVGAAFCHSRTWWTGDELFVDEFYIASACQRMGLGAQLMARIEAAVIADGLNGITLLTNRHFPAMDFYRKNSFVEAEQVVFLYKDLI